MRKPLATAAPGLAVDGLRGLNGDQGEDADDYQQGYPKQVWAALGEGALVGTLAIGCIQFFGA